MDDMDSMDRMDDLSASLRQRLQQSVRKHYPWPTVRVHPETACAEGIAEGDWIWIETKRGRVRQKVKFFDKMDPNIIDAEHGWLYPEMAGEEPSLHGAFESNINVCMSDNPDHRNPELGSYPLPTALCRIIEGGACRRIMPAVKRTALSGQPC